MAGLLALSENYIVKLWDVATLRELPSLKVPNSGAFIAQGDAFMSFSEDGKRIATGGFDTDTIVWEIETGKRLSTSEWPHEHGLQRCVQRRW